MDESKILPQLNSPFAMDVSFPPGSTNNAYAPGEPTFGPETPPTPRSPKEGATAARAVTIRRVSFSPRVLFPIEVKIAVPIDIGGRALYVAETTIPNVVPPPPRICHADDTISCQTGNSLECIIMTYRPEQVRIRAFTDGLSLSVRRNNIHLEKIVDAKSETGRQDGVAATLGVNHVF